MEQQFIEPILDPNNYEKTILPIKHYDIWEMYKSQEAQIWKAEIIDASTDYDDYILLSSNIQHSIKHTLAFFSFGDALVNNNLRQRFVQEIKYKEALCVYDFQVMMENVHAFTYSIVLDAIIRDLTEKNEIFHSLTNIPVMIKINSWVDKWINSTDSFCHRLIAFAVLEGVMFSGTFAFIFWIKNYKCQKKQIMKGLITSNDYIARDEGMHRDFACLLYKNHIINKLSYEEVLNITIDGLNMGKELMDYIIEEDLEGLTKKNMNTYLEYIHDHLLNELGYSKKYFNVENPLYFMEKTGISSKSNFFECHATEYSTHTNYTVSEKALKQDLFMINF